MRSIWNRVIVIQRKTRRPVLFVLFEPTHVGPLASLERRRGAPEDDAFSAGSIRTLLTSVG